MRWIASLAMLVGCRIGFDPVPVVDGGTGRDDVRVVCTPGQPCVVACTEATTCAVDCNGAEPCVVSCPPTGCTVTSCTSCVATCGDAALARHEGAVATCP